MSENANLFEELLSRLGLDALPTYQQILESMDPLSWTLVLLLTGAVVLGVFFTLNTRYRFHAFQEAETTPEILLARLKQDPTYLTPTSIVNRLGADTTLLLLEHGDQITAPQWRAMWNRVREELLGLLSSQRAFGPIYALAHYYQSTDTQEPDSMRIRRTALIHKLGQRRHLEPGADGMAAQLRLIRHPAEQLGELGFDGPTVWLENLEETMPVQGPIIQMDSVRFDSVDRASVNLLIQRTPTVGGNFNVQLEKRNDMWVVVGEQVNWAPQHSVANRSR